MRIKTSLLEALEFNNFFYLKVVNHYLNLGGVVLR